MHAKTVVVHAVWLPSVFHIPTSFPQGLKFLLPENVNKKDIFEENNKDLIHLSIQLRSTRNRHASEDKLSVRKMKERYLGTCRHLLCQRSIIISDTRSLNMSNLMLLWELKSIILLLTRSVVATYMFIWATTN